jgi:acyl-CoA synthetase (AMP-forming)/AMP-acid ligase II
LLTERDDPIPIGVPCANTEVLVLKDDETAVDPGEVGELCVRGPTLMKGYWGLGKRTADVLVRRPVPPAMIEENIYRTGDLVRQGDNGNLIFLGRRDNQIKSRGYRIELGEIETVLYRHPKVEEAAVIAVPDEEIGSRIQAIVVGREGDGIGRGELEAFCSQHIPKYMIPCQIEFRSALPKTSTGKVDRARLLTEQLQFVTPVTP